MLLGFSPAAAEVIVVDQTPEHDVTTAARLSDLVQKGRIRLLHQTPSIPKAMNRALKEATSDIVLFVDDDIIPAPDLISRHIEAHRRLNVVAVVGQVLQPGEEPSNVAHLPSRSGLCPA